MVTVVLDGSDREYYTSVIIHYRSNIYSINNDLYNLPINNNDIRDIRKHLNEIVKILDRYINK